MFRDAINQIRFHPGRVVATLVAIAISVGFMAGAVTFISTTREATAKLQSLPLSHADLVLEGKIDDAKTVVEAVRRQVGVRSAEASYQLFMPLENGPRSLFVDAYSVPGEEFRWSQIVEGRWPGSPQELALSSRAAAELQVKIGSEFKLFDGAQTVRVVGITNDPVRPVRLSETAYTVVDESADIGASKIIVSVQPGTQLDVLKTRLESALRPLISGIKVSTGEEARQENLNDLTGEFDVLKYLLLAFAVISLLVGMIIIANTFNILLAQRRRQIGLLRAVGASGSQVRSRFLAEALLLGVLGSVLGVVLGLGAAAIGAALLNSLHWGLTLPWLDLALAFVAGVLATVVSAILPSMRAMRVSPMEALQAVPTEQRARRITIVRYVVCGLFGVLGIALVYLAVTVSGNSLIVAIGAGFALTIAVLGSAPIYIPWMLRGLGRVLGFMGPSVRLAAANAVRNPQRTAATATALMLAVGLIVTLQVGVSTMRSTTLEGIYNRFPLDLVVTSNDDKGLTPGAIEDARALPGVARSEQIKGGTIDNAGSIGRWNRAVAADGAMQRIKPGVRQSSPTDGEAHVSPENVDASMVGQQVRFRGLDGTDVSLTLVINRFVSEGTIFVTEATLAKLVASPETVEVWLALKDRSQVAQTMKATNALSDEHAVEIGGQFAMAHIIEQIINIMLVVLSALLGVAVLIALVGVANTLGLSVIERKRESALLRALGMQKSGLRRMLLIEALLIAVSGSAIGIAAGAFFGWLGTYSAYKEVPATGNQPLVYSVDLWWTGGLLLIAILAAALASVLPGRRAANAMPREALAEE